MQDEKKNELLGEDESSPTPARRTGFWATQKEASWEVCEWLWRTLKYNAQGHSFKLKYARKSRRFGVLSEDG